MTKTTEDRGLVLIAGAGSGLGASLMQKFSNAGYDPIGINRSKFSGAAEVL